MNSIDASVCVTSEIRVDDCLPSPRNIFAKRAHITDNEGDFLDLQPPTKLSTITSNIPIEAEIASSHQHDEDTEVVGRLSKTRLVHLCDDVIREIFEYYLFDLSSLMRLWFTGDKLMQYCEYRLVTRVSDVTDDIKECLNYPKCANNHSFCSHDSNYKARCINHFYSIRKHFPNTRRVSFGISGMQHTIFPSKLNHLTIDLDYSSKEFDMASITHPDILEYFKITGPAVEFVKTHNRVTVECASKFKLLHTLICSDVLGPIPPSVTHLEVCGDFQLSRSLPPNLKTLIIDRYMLRNHAFPQPHPLPPTLNRIGVSIPPFDTVEGLVTYCPSTVTEIEQSVDVLKSSDIDRLAAHFPKLNSVFLDISSKMIPGSDGSSCRVIDLRILSCLGKLHIWIDIGAGIDFYLPPKLHTLMINNDDAEIIEHNHLTFRKTKLVHAWSRYFR